MNICALLLSLNIYGIVGVVLHVLLFYDVK